MPGEPKRTAQIRGRGGKNCEKKGGGGSARLAALLIGEVGGWGANEEIREEIARRRRAQSGQASNRRCVKGQGREGEESIVERGGAKSGGKEVRGERTEHLKRKILEKENQSLPTGEKKGGGNLMTDGDETPRKKIGKGWTRGWGTVSQNGLELPRRGK